MKNKELNSALDILFANASDGILLCDGFGRIIKSSPSFEKMLGYSSLELKDKTTQFLHANYEDSKSYNDFTNTLFRFGTYTGDFLYRRKDGSLIALEAKFNKLDRDEGENYHYLGVLSGAAQYENKENVSLAYNTSYDLLTGLLRTGPFLSSLEPVLKKVARDCSVLALISLKLVGMAELKQKLGMKKGDDMVRRIASSLQKNLRESDLLGQNSPYSFIMAGLDTYTQDQLEALITKIIKSLTDVEGFTANLKYAIGVSLYPVSGDSVQALVDRSIFAMNQASTSGRSDVVFADSFENNLFNYPEVR